MTFLEAIAERVLICDGATGTMLHSAGVPIEAALPALNLSNPGLVRSVHDGYLAAGADVIQANTFGATRLRLAQQGLGDRVREINAAGVEIARRARTDAGREVFVAGSVTHAAPLGLRPRVSADQRVEAVSEQVEALAEAGVDLLILETFGYLPELVEAVAAARAASDVPIVAQMTFSEDGKTLGGDTPAEVAAALTDAGADLVGTNCTLGPQGVLAILLELGRHTSRPLAAQPNAGLPRMIGERRFRYAGDPDYFGRYATRYADAGAALIGGCCGTTPDHIRAAAEALERRTPARRFAVVPPQVVSGLEPPFRLAVEVEPPPGGGIEQALAGTARLKELGVTTAVVGPSDGGRARVGALGLGLRLQQDAQVEPILTVTTWDKSLLSLQADLLGAHAVGLRTIVCQSGSPPLRAGYAGSDGLWQVDSLGLIALLSSLNQGRDSDGLELDAPTSFQIGARCNPGAADLEAEINRTLAKVAAGAGFLITRPVYESDGLRRLIDGIGDRRVPVILRVKPLRSFGEAEYLRHEVPDVAIPDGVLDALRLAHEHEAEVGLSLAEELLAKAGGMVDGVLLPAEDIDRLLRAVAIPA